MAKLKYSKEFLEPLVKGSISIAEVLRKLGLKQSGSLHSYITIKIKQFNIDNSHFKRIPTNYGINHKGGFDKLDPNIIFVENRLNGRREKSAILKRAMIESGVEEKCEQCGLFTIWNNKPITLQIDHIDGNGLNNQKNNLRFLCPNCHSQTDNYGSKNIKL